MFFKIILILLIIIVISLYIIHIYKHYKLTSNYEILQLNEFNKDLFEDYIGLKQPLILMNTLTEIDLFEKLHNDELSTRNIELNYSDSINSSNPKKISFKDNDKLFIFEDFIQSALLLTKEYYQFIKSLLSNITIWNDTSITIFKKEMISPIIKMNYNRNLYMLFDGEIIFTLYPPKYDKYMYEHAKTPYYSISIIHPKTINDEKEKAKYPLFKNAFSIDIIMRPGQILSIPPFWWYSIECKKNCVLISNKSDTIFTRMVNMI